MFLIILWIFHILLPTGVLISTIVVKIVLDARDQLWEWIDFDFDCSTVDFH